MMLKKPKEQVIEDIRNAAIASASSAPPIHISVDTYQMQNAVQTMTQAIHLNNAYNINQTIGDAVAAGFRKLIENTYFEAEFEQDIGLRDDAQKTKEQVLEDIFQAAFHAVDRESMYHSGEHAGPIIKNAIAAAIRDSFDSLMGNIYSDTEFEDDMTLR